MRSSWIARQHWEVSLYHVPWPAEWMDQRMGSRYLSVPENLSQSVNAPVFRKMAVLSFLFSPHSSKKLLGGHRYQVGGHRY